MQNSNHIHSPSNEEVKSPTQDPSPSNEEVKLEQNNQINFDVLDISKAIDIYAEMQSVEQYDEMMRKSKEGPLFSKALGFFKRSFLRVGREAWIDSTKRDIIKKLRSDLVSGTLNEGSILYAIQDGTKAIFDKTYLDHEMLEKQTDMPQDLQKTINNWINIDPNDTGKRNTELQEIKRLLESHYPATVDMLQVEKSLLSVERAKIEGELQTIDAKLNLFDIGRIEDGYGKRKGSFVVDVLSKLDKSQAPKWIKGFLTHPNTAAVVSALATRWGISLVAGTAALGVTGGLLAPIALGAATGGVLAGGRAKREIKDRNAQIDRRGALANVTGRELTDGLSVENTTKPNNYQHSVKDLFDSIKNAPNNLDRDVESTEWKQAIFYLLKHKVGRKSTLNMLVYDNGDVSVSSQHIKMIKEIKRVFPGLVEDFNSGVLFEGETDESKRVNELYLYLTNLANDSISLRNDNEKKYAIKQGLIYAGVAGVVGGVASSVAHLLSSSDMVGGSNSNHTTIPLAIPPIVNHTVIPAYPDHLDAVSVHRGFWYDNGTSVFDKTELSINTDNSGGRNVANFLGKNPTSSAGVSFGTIDGGDFTSGDIKALVTPTKGGPSFLLSIDENGNIQIPSSMQDAFNNKSFAYLEVGKVSGSLDNISINPIATVVGKGNMIFEEITNQIQDQIQNTPLTLSPVLDNDNYTPWIGIPFGGNRYHHLGENQKLKSQKQEDGGQDPKDLGDKGPQNPINGGDKDPTHTDVDGAEVPTYNTPTPTNLGSEELEQEHNNNTVYTNDIQQEKENDKYGVQREAFVAYIKKAKLGDNFELGGYVYRRVNSYNTPWQRFPKGTLLASKNYLEGDKLSEKDMIDNYDNLFKKSDILLEKQIVNKKINTIINARAEFYNKLETSKRGSEHTLGDFVYRKIGGGKDGKYQRFPKGTDFTNITEREGKIMTLSQVMGDWNLFTKGKKIEVENDEKENEVNQESKKEVKSKKRLMQKIPRKNTYKSRLEINRKNKK